MDKLTRRELGGEVVAIRRLGKFRQESRLGASVLVSQIWDAKRHGPPQVLDSSDANVEAHRGVADDRTGEARHEDWRQQAGDGDGQ